MAVEEFFMVPSPMRTLTAQLLSKYMATGALVPGTIVHKVTKMGSSPVDTVFKQIYLTVSNEEDGTVDSLRYLLNHDNFIKPWLFYEMICTMLFYPVFLLYAICICIFPSNGGFNELIIIITANPSGACHKGVNANWCYIMVLRRVYKGVSTCFQHQFTMAAYTVVWDNLIREIPA